MSNRTVIFDFDGTIADSFAFVSQFIAAQGGKPDLSQKERQKQFGGMTMREMAKKLNIAKVRQLWMFFRGRRLMTLHIGDIKPFVGIEVAIKSLHDQGYTIFALSSNRNKNIQLFLQQHELSSYFAKTQGNASILGKRHCLRKILEQNHLQPQDCVVVGDEVGDMRAARRLGIPAVAVTWGYNDAKTLQAENPVAVANKPVDLVRVFSNLPQKHS